MIEPAHRLADVGEYFFSTKLKEIEELRLQGVDVINLGVGSPDMMPPEDAIDAVKNALDEDTSHGYQSYVGIRALRESIAAFYKKNYKVNLDSKNQILPMMGSKEAIMHISMAFLNKADQVLIPALGYPTYTSVTRLVEAEPIYYPLIETEEWEPDWTFFECLDWSKIKIIWLNYPHMPTGSSGSDEILSRFVQLAKHHNVLLCHDNPYSFVLNKDPRSILNISGAEKVAVELNSLSKTFNMAGWRIGWVCGHEEIIKNILKVKSNMDSGMFKPIQLGAIAALNNSDIWLEQNNREYSQRQKIAFQILGLCKAYFNGSQTGMFVWGKVDQESIELSDELLKETGVFITPGIIFGESGKYFVRISLCVTQARLLEAVDRLKKYLL